MPMPAAAQTPEPAVFGEIREQSLSPTARGRRFEELMRSAFESNPEYDFRSVWLWKDWPQRKRHGFGSDIGVDLVAQHQDGGLWAIQCKFYDGTAVPSIEIDAFLATAQASPFDHSLLVTTGRPTANASRKLINAGTRLVGLTELDRWNVDWRAFRQHRAGATATGATGDLTVMMDGRIAGHILKGRHGRAQMVYDDLYAADQENTPLSLTFPLHTRKHEVGAWLDGLLPPSLELRQDLGRTHNTTSQHPVDLLGTDIGVDCAGAVQFCRPEHVESTLANSGGVTPLDSDALSRSLAALRRGAVSWLREVGLPLSFCLSGAQTKVALHKNADGEWGVPHGSTPSTHIVKLALPGYDHSDVVEHICMSALREAGINAAETAIVEAGNERAIAVRRFDRRVDADGNLRRTHQEDCCQGTGIPSDRKYQWAGGPSPGTIASLLRAESPHADGDIQQFMDALLANWVLIAPDAHAKNYSMHLQRFFVRLTPLYDVCSVAPWRDDRALRYEQMSMKSGSSYDAYDMAAADWQACAASLRVPASEVFDRLDTLAHTLPTAVRNQAERLPAHLASTEPVERLIEVMERRRQECGPFISRAGASRNRETTTGAAPRSASPAPKDSPRCGHAAVNTKKRCILRFPHPGRPHRYSR